MQGVKKNLGGRPQLTKQQKAERKEYILLKLEPYLKSGLSVSKALREAKVFNSEFYKYLSEDRLFGEKIELFKQYISVLLNKIIVTELFRIVEKQNGNESKNMQPQSLSKGEQDFLFWFALNSNACAGEWGRRQKLDSFDPEMEIQRVHMLIEEERKDIIYTGNLLTTG